MNITTIVGLFMVGIGFIFGFAAWREFRSTGSRWTVRGRNHRRTAAVFGCVGVVLLALGFLT